MPNENSFPNKYQNFSEDFIIDPVWLIENMIQGWKKNRFNKSYKVVSTFNSQ